MKDRGEGIRIITFSIRASCNSKWWGGLNIFCCLVFPRISDGLYPATTARWGSDTVRLIWAIIGDDGVTYSNCRESFRESNRQIFVFRALFFVSLTGVKILARGESILFQG